MLAGTADRVTLEQHTPQRVADAELSRSGLELTLQRGSISVCTCSCHLRVSTHLQQSLFCRYRTRPTSAIKPAQLHRGDWKTGVHTSCRPGPWNVRAGWQGPFMLHASSAQKSQQLTSKSSLCLLQTEVQQFALGLRCGFSSTGFSGLGAAVLRAPPGWWGRDLLAIYQGLGQFFLCHSCKSQNGACTAAAELNRGGLVQRLSLVPVFCFHSPAAIKVAQENASSCHQSLEVGKVSGRDASMPSHFLSLEKAPKATKLLLPDGKASHFFTAADPITESVLPQQRREL